MQADVAPSVLFVSRLNANGVAASWNSIAECGSGTVASGRPINSDFTRSLSAR